MRPARSHEKAEVIWNLAGRQQRVDRGIDQLSQVPEARNEHGPI